MILISSETIDETFPDVKMCIDVYSGRYHFDQNFNVGGVFLYATEDIPSDNSRLTGHFQRILYRNKLS